jgi:hypothetical protein
MICQEEKAEAEFILTNISQPFSVIISLAPYEIVRKTVTSEVLAEVTYSVIPPKAGIQNRLKILDSGSRFAYPE